MFIIVIIGATVRGWDNYNIFSINCSYGIRKLPFFLKFETYGQFDNSEKIEWVLQLFGNKFIERFSLTSQAEHPDSFIDVLI